jgi:hypothetical protein
MPKSFGGVVNVDIRDSVPDWSPFQPPKAPDGAPNVVYIVLDDVGFSAMACYGGPVETPNIDRVVAAGLRYTQWHTTALCSPTRSCLLTGRNHTRNSMACITEAAIGFPNASGSIPPENGILAEILSEQGWNTYMVGKWHLCPEAEVNVAATRRNWPVGRGFERYYGFLGAETNQWYPDLVYDNHPVDQPKTPEEGYHFTEDITDKALEFIKDAKVIAPDKPFFLYYAPGPRTPRIMRRRSGSRSSPAASTSAMRPSASKRSPAKSSWESSQPTLSCRRSTRSVPRRPAAGRTGNRSRSVTSLAHGTACRLRSSDYSPGWPRSTPGSSPTRTIRSAGCWTIWKSLSSWTTPCSSSCLTTVQAGRAGRMGRSMRTR